jgi:transketolase
MKVTHDGDPVKFIKYGTYILRDPKFTELVIFGSGSSIEVAIKVSEQLRQSIEGLH